MRTSLLFITFILLFGLIFSGCSLSRESAISTESMDYDLSAVRGAPTPNDQDFIHKMESFIATAQALIEELELGLQEAQAHDELGEVREMMGQTHQDLLYIWNKVNNDLHPDHPELRKFQAKFVYVVGQYRLGLSTELEGMESGDPAKLKEGYETSMRAWEGLQKLSQDAQVLW
ncbi:hypothetical protein [Ammoniphilus sp. 3BR4]|uniref:hypothetical protein n=1 Tax=Ammoniphilus sp. 3BR4 TaxID=3158265 RepID=UPI0034670355